LVDLLGKYIHVVSTNPLIRLCYQTHCVEHLNFTPNFFVETHLFFSGRGFNLLSWPGLR
jgi:hypothetical protein